MNAPARDPSDQRLGPKRTATILLFFVTWFVVVGGFYLWRGVHRSTADLGTRLQDTANAKTVQDASIELAARMKQHDPEAQRWYPTLLKMTASDSPDQRGIAAWIMANDTTRDDFHQALLRLTKDPSPSVRANAAVSLDEFKDPAGRLTVIQMVRVGAPEEEKFEGLRALKHVGKPEDLPLTTSVLTDRFSSDRLRDAAKEAAQGIKDRY
jgi:HEAT repeat protein